MLFFFVCHYLALQIPILRVMTTYYYKNQEDALRRAKLAAKQQGCYYVGITLPSGKKGWAIYKYGKVIAMYAAMKTDLED